MTGPEQVRLIKIEIADRFAGIGCLFGFLDRFLKLLFQQVGGVLLGFHRLAENRFPPAVLLFHRAGGFLYVPEHLGLDGGRVGDHGLRL